jgi:hypothetical protein
VKGDPVAKKTTNSNPCLVETLPLEVSESIRQLAGLSMSQLIDNAALNHVQERSSSLSEIKSATQTLNCKCPH